MSDELGFDPSPALWWFAAFGAARARTSDATVEQIADEAAARWALAEAGVAVEDVP